MLSIGIDIGYSSVNMSVFNGNKVVLNMYELHHGRVKETVEFCLRRIGSESGQDFSRDDIKYGAVTGSGTYLIAESGIATSVNETAALVEGALFYKKDAGSVIEIGGESSKFITGIANGKQSGINVSMNSDCSAGTGSFLEEQVSRMALRLEEYSEYADRAGSIPRIAGRCSVFAKTDITHHQQEGVPVEDILLGLAYAVVKNFKGSVIKRQELVKPVIFAGGVGYNNGIIKALRDILKLEKEDLFISENCGNLSSTGASIIAYQKKTGIDINSFHDFINKQSDLEVERESGLTPLSLYGNNDSRGKHFIDDSVKNEIPSVCYMGIDVGSTSTNVVLIDHEKKITAFKYVRTNGNPVAALQKCFLELKSEWNDLLKVEKVCVTGSGRYMIGKIVGADIIKDEITSQAKAAFFIDSDVDTVFEIGGQDSKYIMLENGMVKDFQMNKVCAAGTGSFIEEQAKKFNIPVNDFGPLSMMGETPVDLGERCTVFIESSIASSLARGTSLENIAAGLCYSVAKNYLNRVVSSKKKGKKIFLQGGIAYNQGVVNAFRVLTGREIIVPPFFSVTGAYGAAIFASENCNGQKTKFRGFEIKTRSIQDFQYQEKQDIANNDFNKKITDLIFRGYDGDIDRDKKTVGIPRALFTYGMFSFFSTIFKELGFNVILSDSTNEKTISAGQEYAQDEICYPVKIITGHIAELIEKKVDYIFFPDLHTVEHPDSPSRQNYGCAYMQLAFKIINRNMDLEKLGIKLLSPTFAFNLGKDFMKKSFSGTGKMLGKSEKETAVAIMKGMQAAKAFESRLQENSRKVCGEIKPDEKVIVLISKIYGVVDPVLNMGIPGILSEMGYKVLSFFELPDGDISCEHPNMFWPFGQHILETAKLVKGHPNMYCVFLSHHCCGPDSVFIHYLQEIMSDKPYLNIEVDEHASKVGVITRLEAFINSISELPVKEAAPVFEILKGLPSKDAGITESVSDVSEKKCLYIPDLFPYSQIAALQLGNKGYNTDVIPQDVSKSITEGRKHTLTNELLSLTVLLGDILLSLKKNSFENRDLLNNYAYFIPQFEGAEVDGQYARLVRTKIDQKGYRDVQIVAPFVEDFPAMERGEAEKYFLGIVAGDIINNTCPSQKQQLLDMLLKSTEKNLSVETLTELASEYSNIWSGCSVKSNILISGEPSLIYSRSLNREIFEKIEKENRVIISPLSEALLVLWRDYSEIIKDSNKKQYYLDTLSCFEMIIRKISAEMGSCSFFSEDIDNLRKIADQSVGYYSGAFGRFRCALILNQKNTVNGIITMSSTYENTGISINTLQKGFFGNRKIPLLNLTFDGNSNENNIKKIESFLYYL